MQPETLERLGLTKTEAKIYLLLLRLGQSHATPLIRKAELHRATVYDVLERLIEKGLASQITKNSRRYYTATEPERFEVILKEKEQEVLLQQETFRKVMPELKALAHFSKEQYPVEVLVGKEGLKTAFEDVMRHRKTFYALGAQGNFQRFLPDYHRIWHTKLMKNGIKARMIYAEKCRKLRTKEFPLPYAEVRFINKVYDGPMTTHFYDDIVLIVMWAEQPVVIRIQNKALVGHYKNFFGLIWKMARP